MSKKTGARKFLIEIDGAIAMQADRDAEIMIERYGLNPEEMARAVGLTRATRLSLEEACKRVFRLKHDPVLTEMAQEEAQALGPDVIVTNAEWGGERMTEVHLSVAPRVVRDKAEGLLKAPPVTMEEFMKARIQMQRNLALRAIQKIWGVPRTFLPAMVMLELVKPHEGTMFDRPPVALNGEFFREVTV